MTTQSGRSVQKDLNNQGIQSESLKESRACYRPTILALMEMTRGGGQVHGEQINQAAGEGLVPDGKTGVSLQCSTTAGSLICAHAGFIARQPIMAIATAKRNSAFNHVLTRGYSPKSL